MDFRQLLSRGYQAADRFLPFDSLLDPLFNAPRVGQPQAPSLPRVPQMQPMQMPGVSIGQGGIMESPDQYAAMQADPMPQGAMGYPNPSPPVSAPRRAPQGQSPRVSPWRVLDSVIGGGQTFSEAIDAERARPQQQAAAQQRQQQMMDFAATLDPRERMVFMADPAAWAKSRAKGYEPQVTAPGSSVYEGGQFNTAPLAPMTVQPGGAVFNPTTGRVDYQAPFKPETVTVGPGEQAVSFQPGGAAGPAVNEDAARGLISQMFPGAQITSGTRTPQHNAEVGGAPNSYHLKGQAIDVAPIPGVTFDQFRENLRSQGLPVTELINEGDHWHWAFGQPGGQGGPQVVAQGAPKPETGYRPATAADRQQWGIPDGVPVKINTATGEPEVIGGMAAALPKPPPAQVVSGYGANRAAVAKIDRALSLLSRAPKAVGLMRGVGDTINQRVDPGGVEARQAIMDIAGQVMSDRSGAAVPAAEMVRLEPYLPQVTDSPDTVRKKLLGLKRELESIQSQMEYDFPNLGQPGAGQVGAPRQPAAAPRAASRPTPPRKPAAASGARILSVRPAGGQ